ncbi:MAG: histidine phosphatase family protein [Ferruginibacter sp.]
MKTLYIVRHAKSSWGDFTLPDFERPLNDRGKKDAPIMAQFLKDRKLTIDVFISSPAKRALKTCEIFCKTFERDTANILLIDEMYHAPSSVFFEQIKKINPAYNSAAIFSHNPGITNFVNELNLGVKVNNMPTCAIFSFQINSDDWLDISSAKKTFLFFKYPKSISK